VNYVYDYSKLLGRLREKKITQSELAEKLGISETSLNHKLKSKTQFKQNEMLRVLEIVNIDIGSISSYFFAH
jgi:transcriptional regulator with XRE-family HTH domain